MIDRSVRILAKLREDVDFILYRGLGESGRVLFVAPALERPSLATIRRIEHEYALRTHLDSEWAARPVALIRREGWLNLLLEDPGGEPLERMMGRPMELIQFLRLGISIAVALSKIHARGLIHKDVKPANVLVNMANERVWFTGFGLASRLPRERQTLEAPEMIAGTLAYMAPEQTGRMNRSVDSRSDLYSFGVILYEMLTGVRPFSASDPLAWVHAHIAAQPAPPHERIKGLPTQVSAIILKLLRKTAEERYHTAAGIEADLRKCLASGESGGHIDQFDLGAYDVSDRLQIPEKLYGRDSEAKALLDAFDRVVESGKPELVLISGYSGIGKSSVVKVLHRAIVLPRGNFIAGKFDQSRRDIPYPSLAQAFQGLVRQILCKSEEEVARWGQGIRQAVGLNGQLIVDLIPELELVIGRQPPVLQLAPKEAENRFHAVFRNFLMVFARKEHPLTLFLDDLQWLDIATLKLLEELITHPDVGHLLLIGAYRNNEVDISHPLALMLNSLQKSETIVREIVLAPLSLDDVGQLIAETLGCNQNRRERLTRLVYEKTAGNPFFIVQFLTNLADEHLLEFDPHEATWKWDLDRIQSKGFTDNVVELMIGKLRRLPAVTQEILKQLACVGNSGEVAVLATACGKTVEELHSGLWEAVRGDFIICEPNCYRFIHDRVQEAAYTLIPKGLRADAHLRIGRLLLATMMPDDLAENVFDVVNQLNFGASLISDWAEKERVAELNLQAGLKAKASTAYASACAFFSAGISQLGDAGWSRQYRLAFSLWLEQAECQYLTGNFEESERLISDLLAQATSKIDKAAAYRLRVDLHVIKAENSHAINAALECLRLFGIDMPAHPTRRQVQAEYEQVWRNLGDRTIEDLIDLPIMTDPEKRTTMLLLSAIGVPANQTDRNLLHLHLCYMVNASLKHGTTDASAYAYARFGCILGPVFHQYADGYRFGKLAVSIVEKYGFLTYKAYAQILMDDIVVRTQPINVAISFARAALRSGVETGDPATACRGWNHIITDLLLRGDRLEEVWRESVKGLDFSRRAKFNNVADMILSQQRFVLSMQGRTTIFGTFNDPHFNEESFETRLTRDEGTTMACWYWILKLKARFLSGDYAAAIASAEKAKGLLWASECYVQLVDYHQYAALAFAAIYENAPGEQRRELIDGLELHLSKLQEWAENCPATFVDKYKLVAAEFARIQGQDNSTMRLYKEAIRAARENGFAHGEGLTSELAARFYFDRGFEAIAIRHLRNARYCYLRWGALGKVRQLDQCYPEIGEENATQPGSAISQSVEQFDHMTIVRASQAMSGEIFLEKLIETLMVLTVQNAAAERGLLLLPQDNEQRIEAEAVTVGDRIEVHLRRNAITQAELPTSLLYYVVRTKEPIILNDALIENPFSDDEYIQRKRPRSILCLPLLKSTKLMGLLYLENTLSTHLFTSEHLAVLKLLGSQAAISLDNARLYADLAQENSDRKRAEEALSRLNRTLQTVYECNHALVHSTDEQELLQSVCNVLVEVGGLRLAWVGECPDDAEKTIRPVAKAGYGLDYLDHLKLSWGDGEGGQGPAGAALREGKPYWAKDVRSDPRWTRWRAEAVARGYVSGVALPLIDDDKRLGVLCLYAADLDAFNEKTINRYNDFANNLTFGMVALKARAERKRVEQERLHLIGEIHDSLAHIFTAISMQLGAGEEVIRTRGDNGITYVERASDLARFGLAEARRFALRLQPNLIERSGLIDTLQILANRSNIPGKLHCLFQSGGVCEESVPPAIRQDLLRISQEAISNAVRHAEATFILLSLRLDGSNLVLQIEDNGSGMKPSQEKASHGFGLANMRMRAKTLGAKLEIETAAGRGTRITVSLPVG